MPPIAGDGAQVWFAILSSARFEAPANPFLRLHSASHLCLEHEYIRR